MFRELAMSPLKAPKHFRGPVARRITDVLFLLLFLCTWAAMTIIGADSIAEGKPIFMLSGMDYNGRNCGVHDDVKNKPRLYFINTDGTGVCVESCPTFTEFNTLYACMDTELHYAKDGENELNCKGLDAYRCKSLTMIGSDDPHCMLQIKSMDIFNHCFPFDPEMAQYFSSFGGSFLLVQNFIDDLFRSRYYILSFGFIFSVIFGFLSCLVLRRENFITYMTYGSVILVILAFGFLGRFLLRLQYTSFFEMNPTQVLLSQIFGYASFTFSILSIFAALYLRNSIKLSTIVMEEATQAITQMPAIGTLPIFEIFGVITLLGPLIYFGTIKEKPFGIDVVKFEFLEKIQARTWFMIFCFIWMYQYVFALGQIAVALSVSKYYFSDNKTRVGSGTYIYSMNQTLFNHMGTAAFGSFLITFVQTACAMILYVLRHLQITGNRLLMMCFSCFECIFFSLSKIFEFANKNAYIQTAIFSRNFLVSSRRSCFLIYRNLSLVATVSVLVEFIVVAIKMMICLSTMLATAICLKILLGDELSSVLVPSVLSGFVAYITATLYAELFSMAAATILQCYVADQEMFPDGIRPSQTKLYSVMESC